MFLKHVSTSPTIDILIVVKGKYDLEPTLLDISNLAGDTGPLRWGRASAEGRHHPTLNHSPRSKPATTAAPSRPTRPVFRSWLALTYLRWP